MAGRIAIILILVVVGVASPARSQESAGDDAREIVGKREYEGYHIVLPRGSNETISPPSNEDDRGNGRGAEASPPEGDNGFNDSSSSFDLPVGLLEFIGWAFIVLLAAVVIVAIVRWLMDRSATKIVTSPADDDGAPIGPASPAGISPSTLDLLQREYEEALARGDYARAALLRFKIFWLREGWDGCLDDDDVKTWRDALIFVDGDARRGAVRRLLGLVERVRYAEYAPAQAEFAGWRKRLESIEQVESP
ncbi:MAG: hypothetical protein HUU29_02555 [Planctomycetaceae bacterium]|nr:hypothetical protein [Planctomycetaceae bacterium]